MSTLVCEETVASFEAQGAAVLRGVFADWVETLRAGVDHNMRALGPDGKFHPSTNASGRFMSDYCNWQRIPEYRSFVYNSPAAAVAAALMRTDTVQVFHEHVLVKEASTDLPTPWHQDQPYYCVEAPRSVSLWIPLDPVPRSRTLEFIAGSHRDGKFYQPRRFNGQALNEGDGLEALPDIDGNRDAFPILAWALEPGDAVAFNFRTVHGAPPNDSATVQRRAFSLRLVGPDARFMRREGLVSSPPFPNVTLKNGEPLSGEAFPFLMGGS